MNDDRFRFGLSIGRSVRLYGEAVGLIPVVLAIFIIAAMTGAILWLIVG